MRTKQQLVEDYLVAGARLGSHSAIAKLAVLRGPGLYRHAMRLLGNSDDAHDAVQEAWIEIIKGLPRLRDERAFAPWAYRILTRRVARIISVRIRDRTQINDTAEPDDVSVPETGSMAADAYAVRQAIKALPPPQAAAISLFYLEGMSIAEAAMALDVPTGTIKTRLRHARTKLNKALKGDLDE